MIKADLHRFMDHVISHRRIGPDDVVELRHFILPKGVTSRAEAEALLSLDRYLDADASWREALIRLIVDFVVWGSRPAGVVTAGTTRWLAAALDADLTDTALEIAYTVVDEAREVDESLLSLILRGRQRPPSRVAA